MKKIIINYKDLIVNPENYRFDPVDNQDEAIDLMLREKGIEIFNLANDIAQYGLDTAKSLRVLEKGKHYLILDGNRRITAIKCLHDSSLIKDKKLKEKFEKISISSSLPLNISCIVYGTEKDAARWIKLDHTGKNKGIGQDPWESAAIDRFSFKFEGKQSPATQLVDFFVSKTGKKINTKKVKVSTINRIISNPESRSFLGVDIKNKKVHLVAEEKDVLDRLDKLFSKIINDNVKVGEVYESSQAQEFMSKLFSGKKPNLKNQQKLIEDNDFDRGNNSEKQKRIKSNPKVTSRNTVIPREVSLKINQDKINLIYRELREELFLDKTINAAGVLFRVFLETTLDYFAEQEGMTFKKDEKMKGKITKVANKLEKDFSIPKNKLSNIRKVATQNPNILSIGNFHDYVHSLKVIPKPADLILKWDELQEFFEIVYNQILNNKK